MLTFSFPLQSHNDEMQEETVAALALMENRLEQHIRNLHVDMLSEFQSQSQQFEDTILQQAKTIQELELENARLREENDQLRSKVC